MSMMLANKISLALSRVVSAKSNGQMVDSSDEEEEIKDLVQLIDELNSNADLTLKLSNQSKICRILQQSPDINLQSVSVSVNEASSAADTTIQARERIKTMLEACKK